MDTLQSLVQSVNAAPDPAARVRALNSLATELARTGHAEKSFEFAQQAGALAATTGEDQLVAEARHADARCHFYLAEFMPALEGLLQAAELFEACGDMAGAGTAFAGIGICQHRLGAHDDAVVSLMRALDTAREQNLSLLETGIHNSLGSALTSARRHVEAAQHIAAGIECARAGNDRHQLTKLLMSGAVLAKAQGDAQVGADPAGARAAYADGLAQALQALELARALGNVHDEAHCLGQTGTMLRLMHSHAEAGAMLEEALKFGRDLDAPVVQAEALMELSAVRDAQRRTDEARACLAEAVVLARRIGVPSLLAEACEALADILERTGDFAGALAMYKEFHGVRETELASSRKHAATAGQLWLDYQEATRRVSQYRARAETLAADHAALTRTAKVLVEVSQQDPLTGLLNRRGLDARIGPLLRATEAGEMPLVVALIDVDGFKRINDTFSHTTGDLVLRHVAAVIRDHCRQDDLPVRYGGDEFLLVLAGVDLAVGAKVLERLKAASDRLAWQTGAPGLVVTLSIGIAAREPGATLATTIGVADEALYHAKAAGRNCIATAA